MYFIGQDLPYFCQYYGDLNVFSWQAGPWLWQTAKSSPAKTWHGNIVRIDAIE